MADTCNDKNIPLQKQLSSIIQFDASDSGISYHFLNTDIVWYGSFGS